MEILGDRKFVEIPGEKKHELPPLLVHAKTVRDVNTVMDLADQIVGSEDLLAPQAVEEAFTAADALERRRMDLALNLVERYFAFLNHWRWGDGILEWIRQCETTFDSTAVLRGLLRPDVWPHAGRSSFVLLLGDKGVHPEGVDIEKAVGTRLTFRQPPPISCFSDQFLLLLNASVAATAYQTWMHMVPDPIASLPPERFHFRIHTM
jgi:hypothetical protein